MRRALIRTCNNNRLIHNSRFAPTSVKYFSTSTRVNGGAPAAAAATQHHGDEHHDEHHHDEHHHHEHYTDDDGRAFNVPLGEQYHFQGWEYGHYFVFVGSLVALVVALTIKPDYTVASWADEEFLRRKKAREEREKQLL
jgi:ABC-type Zn2+ transport system substrate-binding protein/surface adhesin